MRTRIELPSVSRSIFLPFYLPSASYTLESQSQIQCQHSYVDEDQHCTLLPQDQLIISTHRPCTRRGPLPYHRLRINFAISHNALLRLRSTPSQPSVSWIILMVDFARLYVFWLYIVLDLDVL